MHMYDFSIFVIFLFQNDLERKGHDLDLKRTNVHMDDDRKKCVRREIFIVLKQCLVTMVHCQPNQNYAVENRFS